jgi:hypothetical protein
MKVHSLYLTLIYSALSVWVGVVVKALRYYSDGPGIDSRCCHWIFQWHISFRPYHGPGVESAPGENEYQECFMGVKAADAWGWRLHQLLVPNVMEIWDPKPPGTLLAKPVLLRNSFTFYLYKARWGCTCLRDSVINCSVVTKLFPKNFSNSLCKY